MIPAGGHPKLLSNKHRQFDHPKALQLLMVLERHGLEKTLPLAAGRCTVPRFQANS
jgi:hypothetical protein